MRLSGRAAGALGLTLFLALVAARNPGVWGYLARDPGALDGRALRLLATHAVWPALIVAALAALCRALGGRLLAWAGQGRRPSTAGTAFALGLGTLASAALLSGLAGFFDEAVFAGLAAAAALLGVWDVRPRTPPPPLGWHAFCAALLACAAFHAAVVALAPPTEWDVLAYHLPLPKLYLAWGAVREIPWLMHSHWPHLLEVLYALPLALGRDGAAALLHALCAAALVRATFVFAREELGADAAWLAATLLAAQPLLLRFAGTAHSDGAWALFHFLACASLWAWTKAPSKGLLLVSALLAGFAASTKLFGLIPAAALAAWVFLDEHDRAIRRGSAASESRQEAARRARNAVLPALAFLGLAAAVAAPWYLKNLLATGNPVWPFLSGAFGGRWNAAALEPAYARMALWSWPPDPAAALRYGPQFLLLPLSAVLLARSPLPKPLRFLLFPLPFFLPFIVRHGELWRFLLPFFPAFCLLAAWGLRELAARGRRWKAAAAALWLFGASPIVFSSENNELFPVLGLRSRSAPEAAPRELYLRRSLDHHALMRRASALLGPRTKTLLFREIRGYYLDAPYMWGDPFNQGLVLYRDIKDPAGLREALAARGITHVLVNEALGMYGPKTGYYEARTLGLMERVLAEGARPALREPGLTLYELTP